MRWLPYLYAAGAVFWLIQLAQLAALIAAPNGRAQLRQNLINSGVTGDVSTLFILQLVIALFLVITAAALHAAAFYGMRRLRLWGWIAAVIVAALWSVVLIGIPVLVVLLQRPTRQAFGLS